MANTIYRNTYPNGITLNNPSSTIASTAVVDSGTSGNAVYGASGTAWVLSNDGSVQASGTNVNGVKLAGSGTVNNYNSVASSGGDALYLGGGYVKNHGHLAGSDATHDTVVFENQAGTLVNAGGTITAAGTAALAVLLNAGGTLTNSGHISAAGSNPAIFSYNGVGIVKSSGTITNTDGSGVLVAKGTVVNYASGLIQGGTSGFGVEVAAPGSSSEFYFGAGTVTNYGSIDGTSTAKAAVYVGKGGGSVTKGSSTDTTAKISSPDIGIEFNGAAGTATNFGTITVTAVDEFGSGVFLPTGGMFTNEKGAVVNSARDGVASSAGADVVNFGAIESTGPAYVGVSGGMVTNNAGASITADGMFGIAIEAGTILNYGLVESGLSAVLNTNLITNGGTANHTATIESLDASAVEAGSGTVNNFGSIIGGSTTGVGVEGRGVITNEVGGFITGYQGAILTTSPDLATVRNYGTVTSTSTGTNQITVYVDYGGTVTNGSTSATGALITARLDALVVKGRRGSVTNFGTIQSTGSGVGAGVYMSSGGPIVNETTGLITASNIGVVIGLTDTAFTPTLVNHGLIRGATAVVVVNAPSPGTTIINYGTIEGTGSSAPGIALSGNPGDKVVIEPGSVLSSPIEHFVVGDTIDFAHQVGDAVQLNGGVLDLMNDGSVVNSVPLSSASFNPAALTVGADGAGGTDVTLSAVVPAGNELSGDGESDALMTGSNGAVMLDEVSGGAMGYQQISALGPEWQFEGTGPLGGDGRDQFLLWNDSSGAVVLGEDDGGTASYTQIGGLGSEWQFEGVGALTPGSSDADFLLWNSGNGDLDIGAVNGGNQTAYTQIGGVGSEWSFEGVGGFLDNNNTQFLMWDTNAQSASYGSVVVGEDVGGAAHYTQIGGLDPTAWHFEGSGDLLGDGKDSILLWNQSSGALVAGEVNGSNQLQYTQIGGVGSEWQFLGVGDYDGKSNAEFLMFNGNGSGANGTLEIGTVSGSNGSYSTAYTAVGGVGPSQWTFHPNGNTSPALLS